MNQNLSSTADASVKEVKLPISIKVIMIDLDGTLLDTADDLALAANLMLKDLGLPEQSTSTIRSYIGKGIQKLVKRTLTGQLDGEPDAALFAQALPLYEKHYANNLSVNTRPYPGVLEGIKIMQQAGFKLACITNKAEAFTLPLLRSTGLYEQFEIVLSGDSLPKKKPDPMPLTHICKHFDVQPHEALLIGDSLNDAIAARAAGCHVFCVPYGYNEGRNVYELDCDAIVETLIEASKLISK
ncbi:MAG TPA: phosphoglycolate phosphatase [Nitrosomonas sp.]|jgi:phosphoglycolate phosphatase|nr:phosphoglycolate phosphatase [Nitrosomonas sp.]MBP6355068.1 phosphoglycolate phosphatase [Nitrosomonas sp.]MBP9872208.1 phosphoglycolate phosphatase [Nitrosomonas sp.]MDO8334098.1 phosphoglycolate phosphatase [Nitrosomonas sp.]HQV88095.1 phosphoglycolate phosphatase [Nitrosomonas sp.]